MLRTILVGLTFFGLLLSITPGTNAANNTVQVIMKTTKGDMTIELYQDKAPITVNNFLTYVDEKFYDGTIFHRVVKGFMIQGGGWTKDFQQKSVYNPIQNEATNGLKNLKHTIAMARFPDPHSATCQFFISHVDNPALDHTDNSDAGYGYCVFGKVIEGTDVVEAIANAKTKTNRELGMMNLPRETIEIISLRRKE
jgi:peptidyl-prolyl cis-trans isomerase B (cyclophilin B)